MSTRVLMRLVVTGMMALMLLASAPSAAADWTPGGRVLLDAHNCYPYNGRWADRIDRALAAGLPVAIEQDLVWYVDPVSRRGRSLVAHDEPGRPNLGLDGTEPTLRAYFFERIRPLVEAALRENRREQWPLITLNLDLKTEEPEHLAAVWSVLEQYQSWLTTAPRTERLEDAAPLIVGPVLVLTGESDAQRRAFHDSRSVGERLLVFGAARPRIGPAALPGDGRPRSESGLLALEAGRKTNYHRWWNNPWSVVELGGQPKAATWTEDDGRRLRMLVDDAHRAGLWIRFYTLDGHEPSDDSGGWSAGYNFGSLDAARERWLAAIAAGVDFVAVDQYEAFATALSQVRAATVITLSGELTAADYEQLLERPFTVPAGTGRIEVSLTYSGSDERTVIDLGLRGPGGVRGWSGGGPQSVFLSSGSASYGYQPGAIEPGLWAVVLGVPNIRTGRRDSYTVRVRLLPDVVVLAPAVARGASWYVGDLHAHSGHSDGRAERSSRRIPVPPHRVFDAAAAAHLDFVALTDHNTSSHWLDVDRLQPWYAPLLLLHAREITTYRGHANAVGEERFDDFRLGRSVAVADVLRGPHGRGAFTSINHPTSPDDERCMGCGWNDADEGTLSEVDGVEVVNGEARTLEGWAYWAGLLSRGHHLAAVGGSDEHTPDERVGSALGRPATVVFASELSERAIVEGLKSGRAYVRTRGVDGPSLAFELNAGGRSYEMGQIATAGPVQLRASVTGAAGQRLSWIQNGVTVFSERLDTAGVSALEVVAGPADWFSLIVADDEGPTVISSAIYIAR